MEILKKFFEFNFFLKNAARPAVNYGIFLVSLLVEKRKSFIEMKIIKFTPKIPNNKVQNIEKNNVTSNFSIILNTFFKNKRYMLDEMTLQNATKFAIHIVFHFVLLYFFDNVCPGLS